MTIVWLITFFALLLIEFITVGLVCLWFAVGAFFALAVSFFTESIMVQSIVFVVISVVALIITRPLIKKFKVVNIEPTNLDRVIGKDALVTIDITPSKYGEVDVLGTIWTAASKERLEVGTKVVVEKIEGSKLIVKKKGE